MLFKSKTTCFTIKNDYDRETFSVISLNKLTLNELTQIMTENQKLNK